MTPSSKPTSPLVVAAAWLAVGLPAAWGVCQTALKSVNLFHPPPPPPSAVPATAR